MSDSKASSSVVEVALGHPIAGMLLASVLTLLGILFVAVIGAIIHSGT